jgi:hypothetical protein
MTAVKEKLDYIIECIEETDRLRKRLCALREVLKQQIKDDFRDWYSGGKENASVKRASLDHAKLLRELRR